MARFFFFNVVVCLSLASSGLSARLPLDSLDHARIRARASKISPCGQIASLAPDWAKHPDIGPVVPAKLAYECLTSVPFNQTAAATLVNGIKLFVDFHSTTAICKNPPPDFVAKVRPGYDIYGELEKVRAKVASKSYANEHAFGMAIVELFTFAHDTHFQYLPDIAGTAFAFHRDSPSLVSVSSSKDSLPEIYSYRDLLREQLGDKSFKASPVTHINGRDVQSYINDWSKWSSFTDLDAAYNAQFLILAGGNTNSRSFLSGAFKSCGETTAIYDGPTTEYRFANGTTTSFDNLADVFLPFDGITDGESMYQAYFTTPKRSSNESSDGSSDASSGSSDGSSGSSDGSDGQNQTPTPEPLEGYPPAIFSDPVNNVGGYYPDGDYSDVAVLSIPTFDNNNDVVNGFYDMTKKFITGAKAAGKKKLIIDLSSNSGGSISNTFLLFKILFPHGKDQSSALRIRANEATNTPFNAKVDKDLQGKNFADSSAFLRPGVTQNGASFTNLFYHDLTNPWAFDAGNYYASYVKAQQPFAASDIVLVTNGICSSSCASFVELMRSIYNVQTVALGGRPRQGLMQAVGGSKGTQSLDWVQAYFNVDASINNLSTREESDRLIKSPLGKYLTDGVVAIERQAGGSISNINFIDAIREGDKSNTPLHFVYQPADCRILYSKAMYIDVSNGWKAVADTAWGGKSHCSAGSLGGHGKSRRDLHKRELTAEEKAHTEKVQAWRRNLKPEDFSADSKVRKNLARF
ncbi:hypothetical protein HRS9122_00276 [Pyrenophora teres f. teres]|nr:hypothetical protein HRS9122_00276 [Pyrenophora teres f. teres]